MQFVAGPYRARPAQLVETDAQNSAGWAKLAVDQKAHRHRRGGPAACCQAAERRASRRFLVEMIGLRIVFLGEGQHLGFVDALASALEYLAGCEIFQKLFVHLLVHAVSRRGTTRDMLDHEPPA